MHQLTIRTARCALRNFDPVLAGVLAVVDVPELATLSAEGDKAVRDARLVVKAVHATPRQPDATFKSEPPRPPARGGTSPERCSAVDCREGCSTLTSAIGTRQFFIEDESEAKLGYCVRSDQHLLTVEMLVEACTGRPRAVARSSSQ
ncbi:MAG: hypothetical protein RQ833_10075 [Sphingomonadaceae bacterium]|nr:hypothetical protein [Sphingomonadaceae bacterium]